MRKSILITGSSGLIGSEACFYFSGKNYRLYGIDNNQRAAFFGPEGDTRRVLQKQKSLIKEFTHYDIDIRNRGQILGLIQDLRPDAVLHAAAQPSHDLAKTIPFDDFEINAVGTLNLLEATRRFIPESPFIYLSSNKVYGDAPNEIPMREEQKRWEYADPAYAQGIPETLTIDQSKHSLFGVSKAAADMMVQEYGRYFGLMTCCLRAGCLSGPDHSGVQLHGFISYLVRCNLEQKIYTIFGYKGKQVRDNLHSYDVAAFIEQFIDAPRSAEVYNLGGGKDNSCSVQEAFDIISSITGKEMQYEYMDRARSADHICYYSNLSKIKQHYPDWRISKPLREIFQEVAQSWSERLTCT